jgi:predicted DNA-binding transcriptional regulator AlpA
MIEKFIRAEEIWSALGIGRTKFETKILDGIFTPPLILGERTRRWPESEVEILVKAMISGYTDEQMHEIVGKLVEKRHEIAADLHARFGTGLNA